MLQQNRLDSMDRKPATIAGQSAGKRVSCSPQALPVFNQLVALSNGNYWAGLVVKGIRGLASGRLHMDNIYVEKETNLAYGKGLFYVVLPGVTATLEDRTDGTYLLQTLKADMNYLQHQENKQKPGLWRVLEDAEERPIFQKDGRILNEKYRPVVIGDRANNDPHQVAQAARDDLTTINTTIKDMVRNSGFDLHHTPGDGGIVGLKKAKDALATSKDQALVESATLLANTMHRSRDVQGVLWFADWGGSAVLTRALQVLKGQNIKLDKHSVFLNRPTSSSSEALKMAADLKMTLAEKGKIAGLRPSEITGNHLRSDVSAQGALKTGLFGLSTASAAFGVLGLGPTAAGIVGLGGAMYYVSTTVQSGAQKLKGKKYK
ncbi:hypothetical protein [Marinimicrobium sp. C2-29]|uniref:hypothetical protein n=1 Tax=Marinimicrobium sp. C2-29 TaxID=3139825 RepID=UPI003138B8BD